MNGLDLFSGIGGIGVALEPWVRTVTYCEQDRYAQGVLLSRMQSGDIDTAPIWNDVRSLTKDLLPPIDIIFGGFPCQDISVAGAGKGLGGERSGLFFEIIRLTKETKPSFIFLENVPAIRTRGLREVIKAFTEIGYDCRWTCLSASSVGAPHKRERWFLLAHANGKSLRVKSDKQQGRESKTEPRYDGSKKSLANTDSLRQLSKQNPGQQSLDRTSYGGKDVADTKCTRLSQRSGPIEETVLRTQFNNRTSTHDWTVEPAVGRVVNGLSDWLDNLELSNQVEEMRKYAIQASQDPIKALRSMWKNNGTSPFFQWSIRSSGELCSAEVLFAYLRRCETLYTQKYFSQKSEKIHKGKLRSLRFEKETSGSSHRPSSVEQQSNEYSNSLQNLSQLLAQSCTESWNASGGAYAESRVDRIKCLGNSVVPYQVQTAFKKLVGLA